VFVRILGPVAVGLDADDLDPVGGAVPSAVVAFLALSQPAVVSPDGLALRIWDEPPRSARNAIQVAVSRLRKQFGAELIEWDAAGYRIQPATRMDWASVEQDLASARAAEQQDRPDEAVVLAEAALARFRGEPLAGLVSSAADDARVTIDESRKALCMALARSLLATGRPADAERVLRDSVRRAELADEPRALLIQALTQQDRVAEALHAYHSYRVLLAEELGIDPPDCVIEAVTTVLNGHSKAGRAHQPPKPTTHPLPAWPSPSIGREEDRASLVETVMAGHRLVTLHGPGGVGKTRLAVDVARALVGERDFDAFFVDLTSCSHADQVAPAVLIAAGTSADSIEALADMQDARPTIVVLDNAEHVISGVRDVLGGMLAVQTLTILVTSRMPLHTVGERLVAVTGLPTHEPDAPAVRLLMERAQLGEFTSALLSIAQRCDGMPLALELVASDLRWSSTHDLLDRLDASLLSARHAGSAVAERHLSIPAAIEWNLSGVSSEGRAALRAPQCFGAHSTPLRPRGCWRRPLRRGRTGC
jgi:DNA-binding SARP family transcriptional activator